LSAIFLSTGCTGHKSGFNGLKMSMGNLPRLSDARTRSISPESFTGEKGKGGMAPAKPGGPARELGQGWKCSPSVQIQPGETFTLADIEDVHVSGSRRQE